ncbi:acyl carrier protein [Pseudomonas japonica]|uniref:Acyl carrier protein n=1 Tax=Pseudomonas japonica TaxID=256466 RepID=A0A239E5T4_9PSED|nr:acyl carrier protein [Pseudomonas japonica]SNS39234.1 Acyl carrier protein [Pseudomonas japonica]
MSPDKPSVNDWLSQYLSSEHSIDPRTIRLKTTFSELGLDSATGVALTLDVGDWLGIEVEPTVIFDYPTVELFCTHVEQLHAQKLNERKRS